MFAPFGYNLIRGIAFSYCPVHNEITEGSFREHYCSGSIILGFLEEDWAQQLERELTIARCNFAQAMQQIKLLEKSCTKP